MRRTAAHRTVLLLLQLADIAYRANREAASAPVGVLGLAFLPSNLAQNDVIQLEQTFRLTFPRPFRQLICRYNFGELTIGGVFFGSGGDYGCVLKKYNDDGDFPWWGSGSRPPGRLMIASTDGYVILLHTDGGQVEAYLRDQVWNECKTISSDFDLFVRAAGTRWLEKDARRKEQMDGAISACAGCDPDSRFWKQY